GGEGRGEGAGRRQGGGDGRGTTAEYGLPRPGVGPTRTSVRGGCRSAPQSAPALRAPRLATERASTRRGARPATGRREFPQTNGGRGRASAAGRARRLRRGTARSAPASTAGGSRAAARTPLRPTRRAAGRGRGARPPLPRAPASPVLRPASTPCPLRVGGPHNAHSGGQ